MKTEQLFVYGTLAPGEVNEHYLARLEGHWQAASITGTLYEDGWGAAYGFPGIVLNNDGQRVHGQVFSSSQLENIWEELDEFEGDAYRRVLTRAHLENGQYIETYVYELTPSHLRTNN